MDFHTTAKRLLGAGCVLILFAIQATILPAQIARLATRDVDPTWYEDSELTDLFFRDLNNGWVTGDHGLLLHTTDGGQTWHRVPTNVSCRLESIWFADEQIGWAAGGYHIPHSDRTVGVVIKTVDGGKTWIPNRQLNIPKFRQIQFANKQSGWAIGNGSLTFPSGVFLTHDGGRSWSSASTSSIANWQSGVWQKNKLLMLAADGQLATTTTGGDPRVVLNRRDINWSAIRQASQKMLWAAGNSGWIARSVDAGSNWQLSDAEVGGQLKTFDLKTAFAVGDQCWIAGSPGTQVLQTRDAGKSWSTHATPVSTPIRKLHFVDPQHGWALGSLGTILHSDDAGQTWQIQRGQDRRATMLAFFHDPKAVPFELFSMAGGGEGRMSTLQLIRTHQEQLTKENPDVDRLREALAHIGCSSTNDFFVDANELKSDALRNRLACLIRAWRPSLIVTQAADSQTSTPFEMQFHDRLIDAIKLAADPQTMNGHFAAESLKPWKVASVVQTSNASQRTVGALNTAQYIPPLGRTAEDHAMLSRQLISEDFVLPPEKYMFALADAELTSGFASGGITSGIPLVPGDNARSKPAQTTGNLESLRFLTRKQQYLDQLMAVPTETRSQQRAWTARLNTFMSGLPAETAGNTLFHLSRRYQSAGQIEMTEKTLRVLVNRDQDHLLNESALTWLLQYHASAEVRHESAIDSGQSADTQSVGLQSDVAATESADLFPDQDVQTADFEMQVQHAGNATDDPRKRRPVQPAGFEQVTEAPVALQRVDHIQLTEQIATAIRKTRATLYSQPEIQLPLAALYRNQVGSSGKQSSKQALRSLAEVDGRWSLPARAEIWLADQSTGRSPLPIAQCVAIPQPPRLDGKLDEHFWQAIAASQFAVRLTQNSPAAESDTTSHTRIMFTHDSQFVYLAIKCNKLPGEEYPEDPRVRPRDPDLGENDRVTIEIDVDRDYVSSYQLQIDYRGWVGDKRFGDPSWNPDWFVAASSDQTSWTIEAAIPINALADRLPAGADAWSVRLHRRAPSLKHNSVWQGATGHNATGHTATGNAATTKVHWPSLGFLQFEN